MALRSWQVGGHFTGIVLISAVNGCGSELGGMYLQQPAVGGTRDVHGKCRANKAKVDEVGVVRIW